MSSNIPTRRTTRVTRTATQKDTENANARPSRLVSLRAKQPPVTNVAGTATTTGVTGGLTRATAATAASRAKAAGNVKTENKLDPAAHKRKREALGEVTRLVSNNKPKGAALKAKGKDKEVTQEASKEAANKETFDGVVIKAKTTSTAITRQPLRTVAGPTTRRTTRSTVVARELEEVKEEQVIERLVAVPDENAMAVDLPILGRRTSARRSIQETAEANGLRKLLGRPNLKRSEEDEAEANRVFKKRRTSSEAPEEEPSPFQEDKAEGDVEAASVRFAKELAEASYEVEVEADPDGDEWTDLDADDRDDPLMVSEYVIEIFQYMKELEQVTMPNPNYMESQKELAWQMRAILTDWLVQVHVRFRLLPETLFMCVNIIDRFLSARVVSLAKLQLVGVTCMFIAAKVEEIMTPSVTHFLQCADSSYTESEILQAERYVLKTLEWNLGYPNPMHFLRRVSKADEYDVQVRTIAKYLLEIGLLEWRLLSAPPSLMAAAAIWLARLVLGRENWTPNLAHYSSYAESSVVPTANLMLNYVLKPIRHESFYKKYASKKYLKSSVFVREWALERWAEGTQVALQEELPGLKMAIRAQRAEALVADDS